MNMGSSKIVSAVEKTVGNCKAALGQLWLSSKLPIVKIHFCRLSNLQSSRQGGKTTFKLI